MAVKMSSIVKQLMIHSFRIRGQEMLQTMYPKYPVLGEIQWIYRLDQ